MIFADREAAGKQLVPLLKKYAKDPKSIVLGLPRGGVVLARQVADGLGLPLNVICLRKIGAPDNLELAIGAIDSSGTGYFNDRLIAYLDVPQEYIHKMVEKEKNVARQRQEMYCKNLPILNLKDKHVILVDDGLATGATMKAAIMAVKGAEAERIIVAVPVGAPDTVGEIKVLADEVVCISTPRSFAAVGQFYDLFNQVEDNEVLSLLQRSQ